MCIRSVKKKGDREKGEMGGQSRESTVNEGNFAGSVCGLKLRFEREGIESLDKKVPGDYGLFRQHCGEQMKSMENDRSIDDYSVKL